MKEKNEEQDSMFSDLFKILTELEKNAPIKKPKEIIIGIDDGGACEL